jgi:citrate lyase subunit beta/citryl-CoA lyase
MGEWTEAAPLFCPADRPGRYAKAAAVSNLVILDLEDAVAPANKTAARASLIDNPMDPALVVVRLNPVRTKEFAADMAAIEKTAYRRLMLAKTESSAELGSLHAYEVIGLCETAGGVVAAADIAKAPNIIALMWGAEDLMASLGGGSSRLPDGRYRDVARQARSTVLLAGAAFGKAVIDAVYVDTKDEAGLRTECDDAVDNGFRAKACIHPIQVEVVRSSFRSGGDIEWALRVVELAENNPGVFLLDGQMIDEPLIRQARQVLARG